MDLANKYNLIVVEDAAQAVDSYYKGRPLGSIGHLAAFSFHETKNVIAGEGGLLAINDERFMRRAEIIWEKGTNRAEFFRGAVNKYGWVDTGSSFLPSEIMAAFLLAQLENLENIQAKRKQLWETITACLAPPDQGCFKLPTMPDYATNNAYMFYLVCNKLTNGPSHETLKQQDIGAVFTTSASNSPYYSSRHDGRAFRRATATLTAWYGYSCITNWNSKK